jgi:orotidine-5'-phosphate decarboxylase
VESFAGNYVGFFMAVNSPLIVALDYTSQKDALALAHQLDPALCRLKVGKELFTAEGPGVIDKLQQLGFEIFLDLKFHDIPVTVAKAVKAAAGLGVWMVNVHTLGGSEMMRAAKAALDSCEHRPKLIGVTVLTSMSQTHYNHLGFSGTLEEGVLRLARSAGDAGLDGVVCSAHEAAAIKQAVGVNFLAVTPGIRMPTDEKHDQSRVMSPAEALANGGDYLVMGRSITQAEDPIGRCSLVLRSLL